jgi:hypothetical protein
LRNFAFFLESKIPSQKKTDKISDFSDLGILPPSWTWKEIEKAYRELMKEVDWDDIIDLNFTPGDWNLEVEKHEVKSSDVLINASIDGDLEVEVKGEKFFSLLQSKLDQNGSEALIGDESWEFSSIKLAFEEVGWEDMIAQELIDFQKEENCWIEINFAFKDYHDGSCTVAPEYDLDVDPLQMTDVMISSATDILDQVEFFLKKT